MSHHYLVITDELILKAVKLFGWMTRCLFSLYFFGKERRSKALETLLPKLEGEGKLDSVWHKGEKVYSLARKNKTSKKVSLDHEIPRAEVLIRLWRCRMEESQIIPDRKFQGFSVAPDGGIIYSEERGTGILIEVTTYKNHLHGVNKSKLNRYRKSLPVMEEKTGRRITVLFVIDAPRETVKTFVERMKPIIDEPVISGLTGEERYPFFFTDYKTFKNIPVGKALTAKIYFWHDGKEWRLTNNA